MINLSVCMMVKDEEEKILRCLKSVEGVADQLCLIDTGSTDATPAIVEEWAREHPDIDVITEEHPWENDFSKHRNQSLALATGDWILVIDADEWLELSCAPEIFKEWIGSVDDSNAGFACLLTDERGGRVVCQNNSIRFFRAGKGRYADIVHNRLELDGTQVDWCHLVKVRHDGYDLPTEELRAKMEPRRKLLMRRLNQNPEDYEAHLYLCHLYGMLGEHKEALKHGEAYIEGSEGLSDFNDSIYFAMVQSGFNLNDMETVKRWLEHGLVKSPGNADLSLALSDYGFMTGNMQICLNGSKSFCSIYRKYLENPASLKFRFNYGLVPDRYAAALYRISMICLKRGVAAWRDLLGIRDQQDDRFWESLMDEAKLNMAEAGLQWAPGADPLFIPTVNMGDNLKDMQLELMPGGEIAPNG